MCRAHDQPFLCWFSCTHFSDAGKTKVEQDRRMKAERNRTRYPSSWMLVCWKEMREENRQRTKYNWQSITILARMLKKRQFTGNVFYKCHTRISATNCKSLWPESVEGKRRRKEKNNVDISSGSGSIIIHPTRRHNKIGEWWRIYTLRTVGIRMRCALCATNWLVAMLFSHFPHSTRT